MTFNNGDLMSNKGQNNKDKDQFESRFQTHCLE